MTPTRSSAFVQVGLIRPKFNELFFITFLLFVIGLLMMTSASIEIASSQYQDPFYFLKRQAIFSLIGFAVITLTLTLSVQGEKALDPQEHQFRLLCRAGLLAWPC